MNSPYIDNSLYDLLADLVECYYRTNPKPKNILIFMPGTREISKCIETI